MSCCSAQKMELSSLPSPAFLVDRATVKANCDGMIERAKVGLITPAGLEHAMYHVHHDAFVPQDRHATLTRQLHASFDYVPCCAHSCPGEDS
jgi:hypothetical protein